MYKLFDKTASHIALLAAVSAYIFFFQLGGIALTDPDETFYAQTAKEMLLRNDHLTPYLGGKPQFEKPILFYWLVEASFKAFGISGFAARLPSALLGLIGILLIYALGALLFSRRVGIIAALILATNVEYVMIARACVTDMALFTFMLGGILCFLYAGLRGKGYFYTLSAVSFALAVLTKGPIGIILPAMIILPYIFIAKDFAFFKKPGTILWSSIAFLLVALPWYIVMYRVHGATFIDHFFGFQNVSRFLVSEHKVGSQFYYQVPVVMGGFFPWSAFLPFALWRAFKRSRARGNQLKYDRNHSILALLWFLVIFIFFSISSTKLPTYIFPSFAALALMTALAWDELLKIPPERSVAKGMTASYYFLTFSIAAGFILLGIFIRKRYPTIFFDALVSGAFLAAGFALSFIALRRKIFTVVFSLLVYSLILFPLPLNKLVMPEIERYESSKEVADELLSMMKPDEKLGAEKDYVSGVMFYTGRDVLNVDRHHILTQFLSSKERVWCVLKEKNHRQLYELDDKPLYYEASYVVYRLGKKCIVTNRLPEDGKYLIRRERRL